MYLYNLTLQPPTVVTHAVFGNFSAAKAQEVAIARGRTLELMRYDDSTDTLVSVVRTDIFGVIRSMQPSRLTGAPTDYLIIGSDSGRITILEFNKKTNKFDQVHLETFGRSGCRRIVPGEYLAVDPNGRACMIAAVEKNKLVYVLNRDSGNNMTISSPLEAHKAHTLTFDVTALDVGFENPVFACLELDYQDADNDPSGQAANETDKQLTFYELELGSNHVVRKATQDVDRTANRLIAVPGGTDGPGGVLVCAENYIYYHNIKGKPKRAVLPRREGLADSRSTLIVSHTVLKKKDLYFILAQSEYGDLFKVMLLGNGGDVESVDVSYFDTVAPASALAVFSQGYLFVGAEFGNHQLLTFSGLGDDSSSMDGAQDGQGRPIFTPRYPHKNLTLTDEHESFAPIMDMKAADLLGEEAQQLYAICGRGNRSSMRVLRHGVKVTEMARSDLPGNAKAVWTVRTSSKQEQDEYIVVSFVNATLVLSIGDSVEEVTDSGFLTTEPTLDVHLLGDDSLVQVYPGGIRSIHKDKGVKEWPAPGKRSIVESCVNARQLVIALSGGEVTYFELDRTGSLQEIEKKEMGTEVCCLDIAQIPEGRQRAKFMAVGLIDKSVRVLSLDPNSMLQVMSVQSVEPAQPHSLCLVDMPSLSHDGTYTVFLNVGLDNGVLQRTTLDQLNGQLTDTRSRFLGSRPVKLFRVQVQGQNAVLALNVRSWLFYEFQGKYEVTPLSYETLEHAAPFVSEHCAEGMVSIAGSTLRIISIPRLGQVFNSEALPLRYTPRKFAIHPTAKTLFIVEGDHRRTLAQDSAATAATHGMHADGLKAGATNGDMEVLEVEDDDEDDEDDEDAGGAGKNIARVVGTPVTDMGTWASVIRVLDPVNNRTEQLLELDANEMAFSVTTCTFHDRPNELFLVVGTATDLNLYPRTVTQGAVRVYHIREDGRSLTLEHKTEVQDIPYALCPFQGRVLIGVGSVLRIYDLGKKKLLRKCELKGFPSAIRYLHTQGDRIVIGDGRESFMFAVYKKADSQIVVFADDTAPAWLTSSCMLDYDTVCGGDKFGNLVISRLPSDVSEEVEDDPTGASFAHLSRLGASKSIVAPHKLEAMARFHVGEVCTTLQKTALVPAGAHVIVYGTLFGSVGALLAFTSREDVDFFSHLEMHMRQNHRPLCGRDHMSYRSYYFPVKDTIDGDLCEQYMTLDSATQELIAGELDRTPAEVVKKLEDLRKALL